VTSFYRQLNSYGFRTCRSASTHISHTFIHEQFKRDYPEGLNAIVRKKCNPRTERVFEKKQEQPTVTDVPDSIAICNGSLAAPVARSVVALASTLTPLPALLIEPITQRPVEGASVHDEKFRTLEAMRRADREVRDCATTLEQRNRLLTAENKAILMESDRIFRAMNDLVESQISAIEKLFGIDASRAFADQAKPYRFDFGSAPLAVKEENLMPALGLEFNPLPGQTNDTVFEDDELQVLENIFNLESSSSLLV
jgi:hypothetical protein